MELIHELIKTRQNRLGRSALCTYIANRRIPPHQRLSFVPAMLFFTMGFKDILDALRDESDNSPLQRSVHQHCDEDSFHWQWYLQDLATIDHGRRLLDVPAVEAFTNVWSPENRATREVVYHTIFVAKTCRTPFLRMVIIDTLEATFACFNAPVFQLVRELGMTDQLHYFGKVHQHAEASHAKDQDDGATLLTLDTDELDRARGLVGELFDAFEDMFDCWHAARTHASALRTAA